MSSEKIEQYWKIQVGKDNPTFPFLVVDNWYTPNEEKAVWRELDFFSARPKDNIDRAENTIVARFPDGTPKSNAYRFYLEDYYKKREVSPIFNYMYKQRSSEFRDIVEKEMLPYGRSFGTTNRDSSLVSYYEENDHYKPHFDSFMFTCLIWMVREPKLFKGGDFKLNEPDVEIKLKNNRMVIFPCSYLHSVSPIRFNKQPKEIGYGKYTITHFYYTLPTGGNDEQWQHLKSDGDKNA